MRGPGPRRRLRRCDRADRSIFLAQLARVGAAFALLGLLLQIAGGERWGPTAVFTFAIPPAVSAILLFGAAAAWWLAGRRRWGLTVALAGAALALVAIGLEHRGGDCAAPAPESLRVVTWNLQRRWSAEMAARVRGFDADVLALVEAEGIQNRSDWEDLGAYVGCAPGHGLVVLSRRQVLSCKTQPLNARSRAALVVLAGHPQLRILAVDVDGNPLLARRRPLAAIAELAAQSPLATVIAGDFNTPRRARSLARLTRTHANAFVEAGRGWAATWPTVFPLLDLDQIWLPHGAKVICARTVAPKNSDHRPLVVDLAW